MIELEKFRGMGEIVFQEDFSDGKQGPKKVVIWFAGYRELPREFMKMIPIKEKHRRKNYDDKQGKLF